MGFCEKYVVSLAQSWGFIRWVLHKAQPTPPFCGSGPSFHKCLPKFYYGFMSPLVLFGYSCFTMLCWFLLGNEVNWLCAVLCLVAQSCPTLCNLMDCSLPGSSDHGILQARILEWVTIHPPGVPTQGSKPGLPHCRQILYQLSENHLCVYIYPLPLGPPIPLVQHRALS